ncbi:MAG: alpha-ketoacid dehydrogenase subunit beta [Chloroflexi bacterium]|nr:alpha-ketoacid dehydrogenase subunit beta [Chloroflexota bacterium]
MRQILMREALREALAEEMARDDSVFVMGEDIGRPFGGVDKITLGLWDRFGDERVRNTPISENAIVGSALGAALAGMRPVVEIMYFDFIAQAMDQVVNQAAKLRYMSGGQVKVPMVIRTQSGPGRSAAAQHSQCLEAWFVHVPGLKVVMPSNGYDGKGLLKSAIRDDNPVIFLEHKLLYNTSCAVPEEEYLIPLGQAEVKRQGTDVTIVAMGMTVPKSLKAAEVLAGKGIEAEVIDLRTLSPFDKDTILESVKKTGRLVITHEAVGPCSVSAEISAVVVNEAFDYLDAPIERVTSLFTPLAFAPELQNHTVPGPERIVGAVERLCA